MASAIGRSWTSDQGRRTVVAEQDGRVSIQTGDSSRYQILPTRDLEREILLDEERAIYASKRDAASALASKAKQQRSADRIDDAGFTAGMSGVTRQRALQVLAAQQGFDGVLRTRKEAIREMIARGYRVVGTGKNRRFTSPDGGFYTQADLTKTGMDFAAYLG